MISTSLRTLIVVFVVLQREDVSAHPLDEHFFFPPPTNLGSPVNTSATDSSPTLSADTLTMVFASNRPGTFGNNDLWITTRATPISPWAIPVNLGSPINGTARDSGPELSADGLTLLYYSERSGGFGASDIWQTSRSSLSAPWQPPVNLGPGINSTSFDQNPSLSDDGLTLIFDASASQGGFGLADLWISTRASINDPWPTAINLGPVLNTPEDDSGANLSSDGLTLIYSRSEDDLWISRRESVNAPWSIPDLLGGTINTAVEEQSPFLLADNRTLLYRSGRSTGSLGGDDIWMSVAVPAIAYTRFTNNPVGERSALPSGIEVGFNSEVVAGDPDGLNSQFGIRDGFGHTFRMQTLNAQLTTSAVDLSFYVDVIASLDVRISDTSWEADDFLRVELTNGLDVILVASAIGSNQLNALEGAWRHFRVGVPTGWTSASFVISSSTNSSTGAETIDIDNIAFFGTQVVPEPPSWVGLAAGVAALTCVVWHRKRRAPVLHRAPSPGM